MRPFFAILQKTTHILSNLTARHINKRPDEACSDLMWSKFLTMKPAQPISPSRGATTMSNILISRMSLDLTYMSRESVISVLQLSNF